MMWLVLRAALSERPNAGRDIEVMAEQALVRLTEPIGKQPSRHTADG